MASARRALLLGLLAVAAPLLLAACATEPTPEQMRAVCEAERTRRGIGRLLPPEARVRPECLPAGPSRP
jgi:hypothetical protein